MLSRTYLKDQEEALELWDQCTGNQCLLICANRTHSCTTISGVTQRIWHGLQNIDIMIARGTCKETCARERRLMAIRHVAEHCTALNTAHVQVTFTTLAYPIMMSTKGGSGCGEEAASKCHIQLLEVRQSLS